MPVKINFGAGESHTWLGGFVNLDKKYGWRAEYEDNSVDCLTCSHFLMYLTDEQISVLLKDAYRILKSGGIIRSTEDDTSNPKSDTFKIGWTKQVPHVCLTSPKMMREHLEKAGFKVYDVAENETYYKDRSLMQSFHTNDNPNRVFFIEGIKL